MSGVLSQAIGSRKKVLAIFLTLTAVSTGMYLTTRGASVAYLYGLCVMLGFSIGSWSVFVTTTAEQFGTNLRATVSTRVPNLVRGATLPVTAAFTALKGALGVAGSASLVGVVCIGLAVVALSTLPETYARDLDLLEEESGARSSANG